MFCLEHGWKKPFPIDENCQVKLARVKAVVINMPHIMHVLVDGIAVAHMAGILHTKIHPFNLVLDFMKYLKV